MVIYTFPQGIYRLLHPDFTKEIYQISDSQEKREVNAFLIICLPSISWQCKFIDIFYTFKADGIIIGGEGDIWANENQRKNCTEA